MKLFALLTLCCTWILILDFVMVTRLHAHGDMKQIYMGRTANFEISVKSIPHKPMVGQAHFSIEPKNASTGEPITQALITLIVRLEDEAFQSRAVNSPSSPTMYDANLTFYEEGPWEAEVKIETIPGQENSIYFIVDVSGESVVSGTGAGYFFIFVFGVLVLGVGTLTFRYRNKGTRSA